MLEWKELTIIHQRIAIVGASGQLGSELVRSLGERACALRHPQIEVTDLHNTRSVLAALRPEMVINAAAYNWVDKAEDEPEVADAVNALGPKNLAVVCEELNIPLLHVSTDYVFGSEQRTVPYLETDPAGPVSAYGQSKLAGEQFVARNCSRHFIVRSCGLYGHAETVGKGNFVKTVLRLGKERGHLRIVNDQHCTPTSTADLAATLLRLIETDAYGLYHATNDGASTWFEFAREIFHVAGVGAIVEPITSAEFGAKAQRPTYSVLDCHKLVSVTGLQMAGWQDAVARYIETLR